MTQFLDLEFFSRRFRCYINIDGLGIKFKYPSTQPWVTLKFYRGFEFQFLCFKGTVLWKRNAY